MKTHTNTSNRLSNMLCYLIGPMDDVKDGGIEWREQISLHLWDFGVGVLNPCDKPIDLASENDETRNEIIKHKKNKDYDRVKKIMQPIVSSDLHMVDLSNFVILYIDKNAHMCGSYHESTYACLEKKPIIVCCKQGKDEIPNWLYGIANHRLFFSNWKSVENYLLNVAYSSLETHILNGWRFLDYEKIFNRKKISDDKGVRKTGLPYKDHGYEQLPVHSNIQKNPYDKLNSELCLPVDLEIKNKV